jgi:hypothetical protein
MPHRCDAIGVREGLSLFFRPPPFGHIHNGSYEFNEIAGFARNRTAYDMNVFDCPIGHQQSVFKIKIRPFLRCTINCLLHLGSVVRMGSFERKSYRRLVGSLVSEDAKSFL